MNATMKILEEYLEFIKDLNGVTIKFRPVPICLSDEEECEWRKEAETVFETGTGFPWDQLHEHLKSLP